MAIEETWCEEMAQQGMSVVGQRKTTRLDGRLTEPAILAMKFWNHVAVR